MHSFEYDDAREAFEKALNTEGSSVNNLDLNEDGDIDYVRVVDNEEDDIHAIVLQVPISEGESQDIAVIQIERTGEESAILQIVGDETLYGEDYFVEPYDVEETGGDGGPSTASVMRRIVFNVWVYPSVRFIYRPGYRLWVSPYRWGVYPRWWRPWRPRPWRAFYPRTIVYRPGCRVVATHRVVRANRVYRPIRTSSRVVVNRSTTRVRTTPRKTTVTRTTTTVGKKKNGTVGVKRTTTTAKKTKKGKVTTTKKRTTTTRAKKRGNKVTKSRTKKKTVRRRKN